MMQRYTIECDSDEVDELLEFVHRMNAYKHIQNYNRAYREFDNLVRSHVKHGTNKEWDTRTVEALRDKLIEMLSHWDCPFDEDD